MADKNTGCRKENMTTIRKRRAMKTNPKKTKIERKDKLKILKFIKGFLKNNRFKKGNETEESNKK